MNYYITGFMGSGKTSYGSALAAALGYSFFDLDGEIVKKSEKSISEIFEKDGEDVFRKLEKDALMETATLENTVIACGGGTPCFSGNADWMNDHGKVIYLKMFESELFKRLLPEQDSRPLIKDKSTEELQNYIYNTLRERSVYYHKAEVVIDAAKFGVEELLEYLSMPVEMEEK